MGRLYHQNLDTFSIEEKWKTNIGIGFSSITVAEDRIYTVGNRDNIDTVYCLSAAKGEVDLEA